MIHGDAVTISAFGQVIWTIPLDITQVWALHAPALKVISYVHRMMGMLTLCAYQAHKVLGTDPARYCRVQYTICGGVGGF